MNLDVHQVNLALQQNFIIGSDVKDSFFSGVTTKGVFVYSVIFDDGIGGKRNARTTIKIRYSFESNNIHPVLIGNY